MKKNKTLIKELRRELHYHQMMLRVDIRATKAGVSKCKEIGAKMRELQNVLSQCDVTDLEGNHCPEIPIHWAVVNGQTVHLCEKCYSNVLNGAYKRKHCKCQNTILDKYYVCNVCGLPHSAFDHKPDPIEVYYPDTEQTKECGWCHQMNKDTNTFCWACEGEI
jgi:hypothetical protein